MRPTTVFDAPLLNTLLHWLARLLLKIFGWRKEGDIPDVRKCVMIAAPHTSNWDLPVTLALSFAFRAKISWMGKDALFRPPFGGLFRWLGGIPIDRSRSRNVVQQCVDLFREREELILMVPPEGTRARVRYWKTGFYYIAHGAGVPIVLGFIDWGRKAGGIGPVVIPTGDIEHDMVRIRGFYAGMRGKYPDQSDQAAVSPRK